MSSNFDYHKLYMLSACPENDTTEGLAFLSDDSKIQISQGPRQKKRKKKKRDGCCSHLVLLIPRPLLFSRNRAALRRLLAVRRGNEHLPTPERLSARYAITKHCPPIRYLHNRIELHLACLVLFYDIKVIVFSKKSNCRYLGAQVSGCYCFLFHAGYLIFYIILFSLLKCSPLTLR